MYLSHIYPQNNETHSVSSNNGQPVNAVYCENHTEHITTLRGQNAVYVNSVRTSQETLRLHNNDQPVNAV
jgi:hypothetical protein